MDCHKVLIETEGNIEKAIAILKDQGLLKAKKKTERTADKGIVETYIHAGGRIGAMIELNCETDFVARTEEFKQLAHHLAMQVAAMDPHFIAKEDFKDTGGNLDPQTACLLLQTDIKDPDKTIQDTIVEVVARVGENIKISRFARFELASQKT
ncbi:elongation factor Ts [Chloroflexota bacterium]